MSLLFYDCFVLFDYYYNVSVSVISLLSYYCMIIFLILCYYCFLLSDYYFACSNQVSFCLNFVKIYWGFTKYEFIFLPQQVNEKDLGMDERITIMEHSDIIRFMITNIHNFWLQNCTIMICMIIWSYVEYLRFKTIVENNQYTMTFSTIHVKT